ncbi:SDR family NAD(P)-dependent oxidoreductase [Cystobacter fuscus]
MQQLLTDTSLARTLVQLICPWNGEAFLHSGLLAILKTAALENPKIVAQLVLVDAHTGVETAVAQILDSRNRTGEQAVRFHEGEREVLSWKELAPPEHTVLPWKEGGAYVITGGLGGLALLFAKDLLSSVRNATLFLVGRSPLDGKKQQAVDALRRSHAQVSYTQLDVADAASVDAFLKKARQECGAINGIIHSAGIIKDNFILKKSTAELRHVLAPKVSGALNLDSSSRDLELDFFVMFSSGASVTGNVGQADYAAANAFMDAFAHYRDGLVTAGQRSGRSLSLNWPLWAEGGMSVDRETERALWEQVGMKPLRTETGTHALYECLASAHHQVMVVEGDGARIRQALLRQPAPEVASAASSTTPASLSAAVDAGMLRDKVIHKLKQVLGGVIGLQASKIDAEAPLESYGIDSIVVTRLNSKLAETFAALSKTLLFEYKSLDALADYFIKERRGTCLTWTGLDGAQKTRPEPVSSSSAAREFVVAKPAPSKPAPARAASAKSVREASSSDGAIAIVGMSGRFPQAKNLHEYWQNLAAGRDCITEIPADRWSLDGFYHADRNEAVALGKSYSKWGGFLDGFADFDPLFFNISPHEAMNMDPQERLFLQESWKALEDAGYTRQRLTRTLGGRVGVFAGISKTGFDLYGPELWRRNESLHPLTSFASVANRVSYHLNLKGPSLPIDTMCSSSLSAIHEAIEHLRRGECDMAIAGGVNLYLHPSNYILMCSKRMLSDDGKCRSFGADGNGFVPGEGVAVMLLKRLSDAEKHGDTIYAVLRGSSINHGGRTNGYTVPNPVAQADVVREALDKAGISARAVSYVETHGTGTSLGDPIEVDGLAHAFSKDTEARQYCAIGSAKSNIGHLEAAAGIAGLCKIVLQMQHGQIVPSLHAQELNPNIDFARTPFSVQQELAEWRRPTVEVDGVEVEQNRIAGISSFGAGGSNAHVIVEEYRPKATAGIAVDASQPALIVLSAKDKERLKERAQDLLSWLERQNAAHTNLADIAYSLQVGREAMEVRLAFLRPRTPSLEKSSRRSSREKMISMIFIKVVSNSTRTPWLCSRLTPTWRRPSKRGLKSGNSASCSSFGSKAWPLTGRSFMARSFRGSCLCRAIPSLASVTG